MAKSKQDKLRDKRLNSGPSTRLVSRGNKSSSKGSKSRFNNGSKSSKDHNGLYYGGGEPKPRKPRNKRQIIIMAIILIAFILGIVMGAAFIFGEFDAEIVNPRPPYQNVTKNISQYNNESTNITFDINVTEDNDTVERNAHIYNRSKMEK